MFGSSEQQQPPVQPTPPAETAIAEFAKQMTTENVDTASSAAEGIQRVALNSNNPKVRIDGINALSEYFVSPGTRRDHLDVREIQDEVRDRIAAISFGSKEPEVRTAAIAGLGKSLLVPDLGNGESHQRALQLIMIIGHTATDIGVKNAAITTLTEYAGKKAQHLGYPGKTAYPETQDYANRAASVVPNVPPGSQS